MRIKTIPSAKVAAIIVTLQLLFSASSVARDKNAQRKPAPEAPQRPAAPLQKPPLCLPDNNLCEGDYAYGRSKDNPLQFGKIEFPSGTDRDGVTRINGSEFPLKSIARVKTDHCAKDALGAKLCPGDPIQKGENLGVVLAVFPDGDVVVTLPGAPPFSESGGKLTRFEAGCDDSPELRELIKNLPFIQNALNIPNAGTCELSPKAHPRYPELAPREPGTQSPAINCDEASGPISPEDSPHLSHFVQLLKTGMAAPVQDFLKLWYPERKRIGKEGDANDTIVRCTKMSIWPGYKIIDGAIPEPCAPDVLYSWGPKEKVQTMAEAMSDGKKWKGSPNPKAKVESGLLFASNSAISTYMYGSIGVRIKLKPKTPFPVVTYGGSKKSVGYRNDFYYDFGLSDSSVIESWSYGTPEHYDEIVRDIQRISSGQPATWYKRTSLFAKGIGRIYELGYVDNYPNTEYVLKANLLEMIRMILAGEGRIHYSKGACRNRAEHFLTDKPSYINP